MSARLYVSGYLSSDLHKKSSDSQSLQLSWLFMQSVIELSFFRRFSPWYHIEKAKDEWYIPILSVNLSLLTKIQIEKEVELFRWILEDRGLSRGFRINKKYPYPL